MTNLSAVLAKMNANGENYPCYSTKEMMNHFREAMGLLEKSFHVVQWFSDDSDAADLLDALRSHGIGETK